VIERRQASRYYFGAIAEIIDLGSRRELVSVTRNLSLSGCFVKTATPFPQGTEVRVRIRSSGADFGAIGKVTGMTSEGMGIEFTEVQSIDRALLEKWLRIDNASST
jgi:PilZ domain